MATVTIDARGLKCPVPALKLTEKLMKKEFKVGDVVEITADCPTFENNIKDWCKSFKKVLVRFQEQGGAKIATIQI